jgi:hypothetical protein
MEKAKRKCFDLIVMLVCWSLRKQQNAWIFGNTQKQYEASVQSRRKQNNGNLQELGVGFFFLSEGVGLPIRKRPAPLTNEFVNI